MNTPLVITTHAVLAVICWLIVAAGAAIAVFSPRINDTVTERIGLTWIAIGAVGVAWRVVRAGWVGEGFLLVSTGLAFYVCSLFWKHWKRIDVQPGDKA